MAPGKLTRRALFDCFLAAILPFGVAVLDLSGALHSSFFLALVLLEPGMLAVALWRRREMVRAGEAVAPWWEGSWTRSIALGVLVGAVMAGMADVYLKILEALEVGCPSPWGFGTSTDMKVLTVFMAVLVAPVCEEAFFRGTLLGGFAASGRSGMGILLSGLLFAAVHLKPVAAPLLFADAALLSFVFLGTRSIRAAVIAHAVANALILASSA